jgi:hypothetical protein
MVQTPYLTVVATARNDNHGGNMLRRMQIFVNGLLEQCCRHQLPAELIIVEWNPPDGNPSLADALSWEVKDSPCDVRFVQVPPELHQRLKYSQALPLFQMIAKNVGIRRARGEYILATNIDLLFSDALIQFLAERRLQTGKVYRMDRYDVWSDVPLGAPMDEQLSYCDNNILRVCRKYGIEEVRSPESILNPVVDQSPDASATEEVEPAETDVEPAAVVTPESPPVLAISLLQQVRQVYKGLLPVSTRDRILRTLPISFRNWLIAKGLLTAQPVPVVIPPSSTPPPPPPPPSVEAEEILPWETLPILHTNACGDFTLMSRQDWFALRAYPEWEIFSFHLDSVLMFTAYYAGIEEVILEDPMRTYHIEHSSGWTPEAERSQVLNKRLKKLQIPQLSMDQLTAMAMLMSQLGKPLIFNDENWGMVQDSLPEWVASQGSDRPAAANVHERVS